MALFYQSNDLPMVRMRGVWKGPSALNVHDQDEDWKENWKQYTQTAREAAGNKLQQAKTLVSSVMKEPSTHFIFIVQTK